MCSHAVHVSGVDQLDHMAVRSRHHALDNDDSSGLVDRKHRLVLESHSLRSHSSSHLSAGENSTGIGVLTGSTSRSMLQRHTMGGGKTTEAVSLHDSGKSFTLGNGLDINVLANLEVGSSDLSSNRQQTLLASNQKLANGLLGVDGHSRKLAQFALGQLLLRLVSMAHANLHSIVSVLLLGLVANHLAQIDFQHRSRHVNALRVVPRNHTSLEGQSSGSRNKLLSSIGGLGRVVSSGSSLSRHVSVGGNELGHAAAENAHGHGLSQKTESRQHVV